MEGHVHAVRSPNFIPPERRSLGGHEMRAPRVTGVSQPADVPLPVRVELAHAAVQRLAEEIGGTAEIDGRPGRGTEVRLRLP